MTESIDSAGAAAGDSGGARVEQSSARAGVSIRPAQQSDVPLLVALIHELAEYERLADMCVADEHSVRETIFGDDAVARAILAFAGDEPAGYAIFFRNYSTFLSRPGIYLEDLYVRPPLRGRGAGCELLRYLARYAMERGYSRVEWSVLRWNELATDFYDRLGAERLEGWVTYRLADEALERLATSRSP